MTKGQVAAAIQEFGIISGLHHGVMKCEKCGNVKHKPGWYGPVTIQHPCVECGGRLVFEQRPWEPESFKKTDSTEKKTRSKKT